MLNTEIVDLYQNQNLSQPGGDGGKLYCWTHRTPAAVSPGGRRRPGVLILPGGGYGHVSPREAEPVALRFLARGYAAFVLEYSVAPARFPTALREAAMAMACIRRRAAEFEVDRDRVAVVGFSAGGHLAGCLGTLFDSPELGDIAPAEVLKPSALGLCYPVTVSRGKTHPGSFQNLTAGDEALAGRLSLDRLVRGDMPPVFLWHTRDDETVPVRGSLLLSAALEEAGVDFSMHVYRRGCHGLSTADAESYPVENIPIISRDIRKWPDAMMDFFEEIGFQITDQGEGAR